MGRFAVDPGALERVLRQAADSIEGGVVVTFDVAELTTDEIMGEAARLVHQGYEVLTDGHRFRVRRVR